MAARNSLNTYRNRLSMIPEPGGNGCHTALLAIANLGAMAGLSAENIFSDLRKHIPQGSRQVSDREIHDAVSKAIVEHGGEHCRVYELKPEPVVKDGQVARQRVISQTKTHDEADLWDRSPIRLWDAPNMDAIIFLETLFKNDDLIRIGDRCDKGVIRADT